MRSALRSDRGAPRRLGELPPSRAAGGLWGREMTEAKRRRSGTFWLLLAGLALWLVWAGSPRGLPVVPADQAQPAGELRMLDAEGQGISLDDLAGRIVLPNLWADWCGPCRREAPRLTQIAGEFAMSGVVVVGLNADGLAAGELSRIGEAWGVGYTLAAATGPLVGTPFEGQGQVPHNWLIDRRGRLRASRAGALSVRTLRRALNLLLEEDAAPGAGVQTDHSDAAPDAGDQPARPGVTAE